MDSILIKIQKAQERRKEGLRSLASSSTNAFRAFGGRPEGVEGLTIDIFDSVAIVNIYEDRFNHDLEVTGSITEELQKLYGVSSSYVKHFVTDRSKRPVASKENSLKTECKESGFRFEIHPDDGLSVGLFLDQRENRKKVGELAKGKRFLNLFSYTCGFGVYAAAHGAQTVNVDVSKKYLEWGKRNYLLNAITLDSHKFVAEDVGTYIKRLVKRGERFDGVVFDPPSFGRSDQGVFSIEKDFRLYLSDIADLIESGGMLFASSNFQKWNSDHLVEMVQALGEAKTMAKQFDFEKEENPLSAVLVEIKR